MPKIKISPADKYFSWYVRLRDRQCQRCGSPVRFNDKGLPISHQASHFQGRGKENTRFNEDNVICLCGACHMYLGAHPAEHYEFQLKRLGKKKIDDLVLASNLYCKKDRAAQALYWKQRLKDDYGV